MTLGLCSRNGRGNARLAFNLKANLEIEIRLSTPGLILLAVFSCVNLLTNEPSIWNLLQGLRHSAVLNIGLGLLNAQLGLDRSPKAYFDARFIQPDHVQVLDFSRFLFKVDD